MRLKWRRFEIELFDVIFSINLDCIWSMVLLMLFKSSTYLSGQHCYIYKTGNRRKTYSITTLQCKFQEFFFSCLFFHRFRYEKSLKRIIIHFGILLFTYWGYKFASFLFPSFAHWYTAIESVFLFLNLIWKIGKYARQ